MTETRKLSVLIVDDEPIIHQTIQPYLANSGHEVESAYDGPSGLASIEKNEFDLALVDIRMPGMDGIEMLGKAILLKPDLSVVIITAHGSMDLAIQALRLGAADFLIKPIKLRELDAVLEKASRIRELKVVQRRLRETITGIQQHGDGREGAGGLVASSRAMQRVRDQIRLAVEARCETILITGETGAGKEVVARELHFMTGHQHPFIALSCPALPESLVESELFGHVKGTFTGADADKAGCFELADGGTLFLDEIADLSPAAQAKLLRALETRTVRRVGGAKEAAVNVRVIAATNHPLEELVKHNRFRSDLYYRLNVFAINVPPLRERRDDIMPLAEHFLAAFARGRGIDVKAFAPEATQQLMNYDFPGNVRELKNLIERAAILCGKGLIRPEHLGLADGGQPTYRQPLAPDPAAAGPAAPGEVQVILSALQKAKWNRMEAAKSLGVSYATLRYKIKKYGLS
jgi:DNA-binding NtrC family response regulator